MAEYGNRLKALRIRNKLTQDNLAEILGITKSAISAYENSIRMPSYDILLKTAGYFGVSTDYLLGVDQTGRDIDLSSLSEDQVEAIRHLINVIKVS